MSSSCPDNEPWLNQYQAGICKLCLEAANRSKALINQRDNDSPLVKLCNIHDPWLHPDTQACSDPGPAPIAGRYDSHSSSPC